jgi:hypothetical protein
MLRAHPGNYTAWTAGIASAAISVIPDNNVFENPGKQTHASLAYADVALVACPDGRRG